MKVGVIGAGFTGLSASYYLSKQGIDVTILEKESIPGGLAIGYKEKDWKYTLEKHYHHWFTNDKSVLSLANELGHKVIIKRPKTSVYVKDEIFQFDSPLQVLKFSKLSLLDRVRMGLIVGLIRYNPFWRPLERINATTFLPMAMGKSAYQLIWEPLFKNKFGPYSADISLAWFWARITKRTPSLAYPEGGFLNFANHIANTIEKNKGKIKYNSEINNILDNGKKVKVKYLSKGRSITEEFDKVVFTLPSFLFLKTASGLPSNYKNKFTKLRGLGATNLVLRLSKPFLEDGTYWLNVCEKSSPIMAIVDHTNFMDKKFYNNENILYLGNYLPNDHPQYQMEKDELLDLFDPFLRKINPQYKKTIIDSQLFKAPFAQPIIPTHYSKIIPPTETPLRNVYLSNIEQVYPWDRGTNYAVELGKNVADRIINGLS